MKLKLIILLLFVNTILFSQNRFEVSLGGGANTYLIPNSIIAKENTENVVANQYNLNLSYEIIYNISVGVGIEYATHQWKELNIKSPWAYSFGDYTIDALKSYSLYNYPIYLQYEYKKLNKLTPYVKAGYSFTKIKHEKSTFLKAKPDDKYDFLFNDTYNYDKQGREIYIDGMNVMFVQLGIKYKLSNNIFLGLNAGIKKYKYYWYSKERIGYTPESNLFVSFKF